MLFDGWYSSLDNLKLLRGFGWMWLTRLKANRLVNKDRQGPRPLSRTEIAACGTVVWLSGYGLVKVFKIVAPDGDIAYWATNDLTLTDLTRQQYAEFSWTIENYHRGIKQCTEVEQHPGAFGGGAAEPHRSGAACVLAAGILRVYPGRELVGGPKTAIIRDAVRSPTLLIPGLTSQLRQCLVESKK